MNKTEINTQLNDVLLRQSFTTDAADVVTLDRCLLIAENYAIVENSLAVLSDLNKRRSYIFYGGLGEMLGIGRKGESSVVETIWEEEIFERIAQADILRKQLDELKFFHFIRRSAPAVRSDYYMECTLQMCDKAGKWYSVRHRISYFAPPQSDSIPMALCLYNIVPYVVGESRIVNSRDGSVVSVAEENCATILSEREKEILSLISCGRQSKHIASQLSISVNTVNRHRQNILAKLGAGNSLEACSIAERLGII